jgi:Flp pilus assembly secretin CpaC
MSIKPSALFPGLQAAAVFFLMGALLPTQASAAGEPISVTVDRAKVMHISRPANVVIIGNPAIADATIQDNQTLIITGHSFGTTNLIILDSTGASIAEETLTVQAANDDLVTVYKRSDRQTFSCTPDCSPTVTIGDTGTAFDAVRSQVTANGSLASSSSAAGGK